EEDRILDAGGASAAARDFLTGDTFVVLTADTAIDLRLRDVVAFHADQRATATMVLRANPDAARYGVVEIDAARRIRRILGQPPRLPPGVQEALTPLMFAGIHVFEPSVFDHLPGGVYSVTRTVYPSLLAAGQPVDAYIHDGYWRGLDTPDDLAAGRRELAARR